VLGSNRGVYLLASGATSFTAANTGFEARAIGSLAGAESGVVYAVSDGDLYRSADSGASWSAITFPSRAVDVMTNRSVAGQLWITTGGGSVYRSTNSGASWAASTTSGLGNELVVQPGASPILWTNLAGSAAKVMRSSDGGDHFIDASTNLTGTVGNDEWLALDPAGPTLYAATSDGVFQTTDANGTVWSSFAPAGSGFKRLFFAPGSPGQLNLATQTSIVQTVPGSGVLTTAMIQSSATPQISFLSGNLGDGIFAGNQTNITVAGLLRSTGGVFAPMMSGLDGYQTFSRVDNDASDAKLYLANSAGLFRAAAH
jgi:hypothetical protein